MDKHDLEIHSISERLDNNKDIKSVLIFLFVTSFVQLVTVGVYSYNAYKDRVEEGVQQTLNRQLNILIQQYDRQDKKFKEISYPLIALRANLIEIEQVCKVYNNSPPTTNAPFKILREQLRNNRVNLTQAFGASQVVFGEDLFNRIQDFAIQVEKFDPLSNSDLCNQITSATLDQIHRNAEVIDRLMYASMSKTRSSMDDISIKLLKP
jgi:hypothetical protein